MSIHPHVIKIAPLQYLHVVNTNSNVTTLIIGPRTYTCMGNQRVVLTPHSMVVIPSAHYCVVENPVKRTRDGAAVADEHGQVQLRYGETEIRFSQPPFPLYPGEAIEVDVRPIQIIPANEALVLRAKKNFVDHCEQGTGLRVDPEEVVSANQVTPGEGGIDVEQKEEEQEIDGEGIVIESKRRRTGDKWLVKGPGRYYPRVEEEILEERKAIIVEIGAALLLSAREDCIDECHGLARKAGDRWLMQKSGVYMPGPHEVVERVQKDEVLSEESALHMKATHDFHDNLFDVDRVTGDEWLVTSDHAKTYTVGAMETFVKKQGLVVLTASEYIVLANPYDEDEGKHLIGEKRIVRGPKNFFLRPPYETIEQHKKQAIILGAGESLIIFARMPFEDRAGYSCKHDPAKVIQRRPGDEWRFYGPGEYWPQLGCEVKIEKAVFGNKQLGLYVFTPQFHAGLALIVALVFVLLFL